LAPWRRETFKFSTDPELEAKVRDVVGLYLKPPDKAVVLSIDEKSQIQALDRTAPILPMRPGLPEKATHDYVRHGTTTLFAALEVATGKVTDACYPRHRHEEFLRFLKQIAKAYPRVKLHIVCDNYATHKHPNVQAWLAKHPRITLHFTPTSGSWLNLVEILRHHHPPGNPPRHLHLREGPHRRHRDLHRRLERALPAVRVDQDHRRNTHQSHQRSKIIVHATLGQCLSS
jgi:transposase